MSTDTDMEPLFLGLYLTDLTFCHEGNPVLRTSPLDAEVRLINFDRYHVSSNLRTVEDPT